MLKACNNAVVHKNSIFLANVSPAHSLFPIDNRKKKQYRKEFEKSHKRLSISPAPNGNEISLLKLSFPDESKNRSG